MSSRLLTEGGEVLLTEDGEPLARDFPPRGSFAWDSCCGCAEGCRSLLASADKWWGNWGPQPLWLQGTRRYDYGDSSGELEDFLAAVSDAGFSLTTLTHEGVTGAYQGDAQALTRYRRIVHHAEGNALLPASIPWEINFTREFHRYSGERIYERGTNAGGTWYAYDLDDEGVVTESGDRAAGWEDHPESGVPQDYFYNWPLAISTEAGSWAELIVTETSALLTIHAEDSGFDYEFSVTVSEPYPLATAIADTQALLDELDLTDLAKIYPEILTQEELTLQWDRSYLAIWRHGPGVPLEIQYELTGFYPPVLAERRFSEGGFSAIRLTKTLAELGGETSALYAEEQSEPVRATEDDPWNGENIVFPADTLCLREYTDAEIILTPTDIPFGYGRAQLLRVCAGLPPCEVPP